MNHFFLDTNVLIDFLANRKPFAMEAAKLFDLSFKKKINLYVSAVSYNNIYYILIQSQSHAQTLAILNQLNEWTEILDVSKSVINKALKSDFKYFEDAIQYHCAKSATKMDAIITRDTNDFKTSSISVLSPKEALSMLG